METYQRSGKIPSLGGMLVTVIGTTVTVIAAVIYTYATVYIPIIYLNFLITLGFGFVIGYAVGKAALLGKVRNLGFVMVAAVICGLVGIYMEWVTTLFIFVGPELGLAIFSPFNVLAIASALYAEGSWGMSDGANVTGVMLAIIWLIEMGMILGTAVITAMAVGGSQPFCEACNGWTTTHKGINRLQPGGGEDLWERVLTGDLIPLDSLVRASGSEQTYIRFDAASCPHCTGSDFLTINVVQKSLDDKGNESEKETALGEHLYVTREHIEFIRGCGLAESAPSAKAVTPSLDDLEAIDHGHDNDAKPEDFNFTEK